MWFWLINAYTMQPTSAALPYSAPAWNASGSRFMQMSRRMPPPTAVMVPRMMDGMMSSPADRLLLTLMTAQSATDRLSSKSTMGSR